MVELLEEHRALSWVVPSRTRVNAARRWFAAALVIFAGSLLAARPAMAEAAPAESPPAAPAPGPVSPGAIPGAPPAAAAFPGGIAPAANVNLHGSLLIWPFDASGLNQANTTAGLDIANEIATVLTGSTQVRPAPLRPDATENTPSVQRMLQEGADRPDLTQIVASDAPSPRDAVDIAHRLGYDYVMTGVVRQLSFSSAAHTATAAVSAQIFDARTGTAGPPVWAGTVNATAGPQPAELSAATVERMALDRAARGVSTSVAPLPAAASVATTKKDSTGPTVRHYLPYVIGAVLLGVFVAVARGG